MSENTLQLVVRNDLHCDYMCDNIMIDDVKTLSIPSQSHGAAT